MDALAIEDVCFRPPRRREEVALRAQAGSTEYSPFFDWSDACVAHPFFDLVAMKFETDDVEKQSIMDAYLAGWGEVVGPETLRRVLAGADAGRIEPDGE
jgi:hypothetical protein